MIVADAPPREELGLDGALEDVVPEAVILVTVNQLLLEVPSEPHGARDGPSVRHSPWNVIPQSMEYAQKIQPDPLQSLN